MVRAIRLGWPGLIGNCRFNFPGLVPLVSDRSLLYNGKTLRRSQASLDEICSSLEQF